MKPTCKFCPLRPRAKTPILKERPKSETRWLKYNYIQSYSSFWPCAVFFLEGLVKSSAQPWNDFALCHSTQASLDPWTLGSSERLSRCRGSDIVGLSFPSPVPKLNNVKHIDTRRNCVSVRQTSSTDGRDSFPPRNSRFECSCSRHYPR